MNERGNDLYHTLMRVLFAATGIVLFFWFLHKILVVILFFMVALVVSVALNSPVTWLEKKGVNRIVGTLLTTAALVGMFVLLALVTLPQLKSDVGKLVAELPGFITHLANYTSNSITRFNGVQPGVKIDAEAMAKTALEKALPSLLILAAQVGVVSFSLLGAALFAVLLFSTVLFIVAHPRPLLRGYLMAMPPHMRDSSARAFARSSEVVTRWVWSNILIGAVKGVSATLFLAFIGVPGSLLWGIFAFLSEQIPKLGPYVMMIPPAIVALAIDPVKALWVIGFFLILDEITGLTLVPLIRSSQMKMHPASLLFAVLAMSMGFGLLGALIASPIAGFVKAYYEEFYLNRQPVDGRIDERVESMLNGQPYSKDKPELPSPEIQPHEAPPGPASRVIG